MGEQENISMVRKVYEAFNAGDLKTILDHITDNVEWMNDGPSSIPYAGKRSGRQEVIQFFEAIASSTTDSRVTAEEFIAQGDKVVAIGRYAAKVRSTGTQIDPPVVHIFTIRDGKVNKLARLWGHSTNRGCPHARRVASMSYVSLQKTVEGSRKK